MITLITGVPGTGKTAFVVSEIEKEVAKGRTVFVDNITGLKVEHYRAGKINEWQLGTWLHIDRYKRTCPDVALEGKGEDDNGNENWEPLPDVVKLADSGEYRRLAFDAFGAVVGSVPYESSKGALLVIDEAQRHFRPRPSGSAVPDHVAALEVHRHQGLDIWLVTQRPGLIDSNVRSLVGRHIALRSTSLGRFKYEWPEVGDIESKFSRDVAARSRYKLPRHVFDLYKSADVHTMQKHQLPLAAKSLFLIVPLLFGLAFVSYNVIAGKKKPVEVQAQQSFSGDIKRSNFVTAGTAVPAKLSAYQPGGESVAGYGHPYENMNLYITGRLQSPGRDWFLFSAGGAFGLSSVDLEAAGYGIVPLNDCAVKLIYKGREFFVTCAAAAVQRVDFHSSPVVVPAAVPSSFSDIIPDGVEVYRNP